MVPRSSRPFRTVGRHVCRIDHACRMDEAVASVIPWRTIPEEAWGEKVSSYFPSRGAAPSLPALVRGVFLLSRGGDGLASALARGGPGSERSEDRVVPE